MFLTPWERRPHWRGEGWTWGRRGCSTRTPSLRRPTWCRWQDDCLRSDRRIDRSCRSKPSYSCPPSPWSVLKGGKMVCIYCLSTAFSLFCFYLLFNASPPLSFFLLKKVFQLIRRLLLCSGTTADLFLTCRSNVNMKRERKFIITNRNKVQKFTKPFKICGISWKILFCWKS